MKICWDNLERIKFTSNKTFRSVNGKHGYVYKDCCKLCGDPYLDRIDTDSDYCSNPCSNANKLVPQEVRDKISKSLKGRFPGKKNPFYGKKHSDETKIKWLENKRQFGKKNHQWINGCGIEPYCEVWKDKEYKQDIMERDNHKCLNSYCSGVSNNLVLHNIDYNKKNCKPSNLITVCVSCNSRANKDRRWHKSWYRAILNKRYGYKYN